MKTAAASRILLLGLMAALIAAFFIFDLGQYLTLDFLKHSREQLARLLAEHPALMAGTYFSVYVLVAGLSLPGALPLSLAGGALFGFWTGSLLASFASSLGALLACAAARYLLRDWVQRTYAARLSKINTGIEQEGVFYLFTLRLIPIFPFFVINLAMGLTPMPLRTFYWTSQLGMLPATLVFVNAGKELGKLESVSGILSPSLILSFVLLGLFPLAVKRALAWHRYRRK